MTEFFRILAAVALCLMAGSCAQEIDTYEPEPLNSGEIFCNCTMQGCGLRRSGAYKHVCRTRGGCQKATFKDSEGVHTYYSCLAEEQYVPRERPLMCYTHLFLKHVQNAGCCHNASFCTSDLHVVLLAKAVKPDDSAEDGEIVILEQPMGLQTAHWLVVATVLCSVGCLFVFVCCRTRCCRRTFGPTGSLAANYPALYPASLKIAGLKKSAGPGCAIREIENANLLLDDFKQEFSQSGSGAGFPILVERTIARQIELRKVIGYGRFGEVHLGLWQGEPVAVKIFASRDEKSWFREVEIYHTSMLRHPNVLGYIASDNMDAGQLTQLWLITEYHPHGSLFDHLTNNIVTPIGACRMARSIANGLFFLHNNIGGTHSKPAIAHRDIKSKNILVKTDLTCCIADLGLAVRYEDGTLDLPCNNKVGTRRYLAPEFLVNSEEQPQFHDYRRADIYSLGLVIWELASRTADGGLFEPYRQPYYDMVPEDPSVEEMKRVVCDEGKRPTVLNRWTDHTVLNGLTKLMKECWAHNPNARLTALRVKKNVDRLQPAETESI